MEWKLTRGKFRPLMGRIKANDKHKVRTDSEREGTSIQMR